MRHLSSLILCALLAACGSPEPEAAPTTSPEVAPSPAAAAPAAAVIAAPIAAAAAPAAEAAPAGSGTTVASLYEGWSATDARIGSVVTVAGTYGNAMRVSGAIQSVSVAVSGDDMRTIFCEFDTGTAPEAMTLTSWRDTITLRGTLADSGSRTPRPSLEHCEIVE
jgi:hypothetical protein